MMATSFSGGRSHPERINDLGQASGMLYHLRCDLSAPFVVIYTAMHEPTPFGNPTT
jgi:hypothetical protein